MAKFFVKTIYILGAPGSGKTTLANEIKKPWGNFQLVDKPFAHEFYSVENKFRISLGKTKPPFSGTDTLSNSVINLVEELYPCWTKSNQVEIVIGEGDRLAIERMMNIARSFGELFLFYLDTPEEISESRRQTRARANNFKLQNPSWVKGRKTKHLNLAKRSEAVWLDGSRPIEELVQQIQDKLFMK